MFKVMRWPACSARRRTMKKSSPPPGSFEAAELFRLELALRATPA
jgi:hypothetical protein